MDDVARKIDTKELEMFLRTLKQLEQLVPVND